MTLAPAKLNLYLDVRGRRPDGYHELETLFVALTFGDEVELEPALQPGVVLQVEGDPSVPAGRENLAAQAAAGWLRALGLRAPWPGVRVRLTKRIPVGGGLGGGSSDAGAVLRLLQAAAPGGGLPAEALQALARQLGADVPFFLHATGPGAAAVGRGRGDELEPLGPGPGVDVLLITPPWGHETARVFRHAGERLRPARPGGLARAVAALASGQPALIREAHENALALAAMRAYPAFTRFASEVERALGRAPCLSGTGSTLYDVPDRGEAQAAALRVRHLTPFVVLARTAP